MSNTPDQIEEMEQIAFVIDGTVQEIIYTQERFAAILTSNPTIVAVSGYEPGTIKVGWSYSLEEGFMTNIEEEDFEENEF